MREGFCLDLTVTDKEQSRFRKGAQQEENIVIWK